MKIKVLLLFLFGIGLFPKAGLTQDTLKNNNYQIWLRSTQSRTVFSGYLQRLSDSTITISKVPERSNTNLRTFPITKVKWVKFRDQRSIMRGVARGALIGFAVGFAYGLLKKDQPSSEDNSIVRISPFQEWLIYGVCAAPPGAIIGGFLGSIKAKISIDGSRDNYARQREVLEQYRLGH